MNYILWVKDLHWVVYSISLATLSLSCRKVSVPSQLSLSRIVPFLLILCPFCRRTLVQFVCFYISLFLFFSRSRIRIPSASLNTCILSLCVCMCMCVCYASREELKRNEQRLEQTSWKERSVTDSEINSYVGSPRSKETKVIGNEDDFQRKYIVSLLPHSYNTILRIADTHFKRVIHSIYSLLFCKSS